MQLLLLPPSFPPQQLRPSPHRPEQRRLPLLWLPPQPVRLLLLPLLMALLRAPVK
jgi:hypothetical protein